MPGKPLSGLKMPACPLSFGESPLHGAALVNGAAQGRRRLAAIPGQVPDPLERPSHCHFAARCGFAADDCRKAMPPLAPLHGDANHHVACLHPRDEEFGT
ncbi:oligopeptide/dipeptide ABC transporter ATP-binding protein [Daeguia caeni]|uniref:Oligopeptide/dipeptide ABC transporter ATP-binding protein n=1 Tax=Daeguia caeni TaxID=439612 RepID=A0ABV9H3B8_9HYPH